MPARRKGARPSRGWSRAELAVLRHLATPARIQDFLDAIAYRVEDAPGSPRRVLAERRAHCYDGALLAAAALRRIGHPPLLLDLRAVRDDDHVLAVFRLRGRWGAIAKSNFAGLRYRDPIHRTPRELALSYFDDYFNLEGEKTLREHSGPFDLARFDALDWTFRDDHLQDIASRLDRARHFRLLDRRLERALRPVDERSLRSGTLGADPKGLHAGA
jgi:hypothetical protein